MKEKFRKTILIICTVVLICCIAGLAYHFVRQYLEDKGRRADLGTCFRDAVSNGGSDAGADNRGNRSSHPHAGTGGAG